MLPDSSSELRGHKATKTQDTRHIIYLRNKNCRRNVFCFLNTILDSSVHLIRPQTFMFSLIVRSIVGLVTHKKLLEVIPVWSP